MSANIREQRLCIGFHKQAALQTPLAAADCMTLLKTNPAPFSVDLQSESNALWIGKDDEFPTNNILTSWAVAGGIEGHLSSEWAALISAFGLGKAVKATAGTGWKYTCTPLPPVTDGIEMPSTTIVETIRQGGSPVLDRALVGCCLEEFGFQINKGAGLQNARFTSQWRGCGKVVSPSTIVTPALTTEHYLAGGNLGSLTAVLLGTDIVTAKTIESVNFQWRNALRDGFYPGSGESDGGQIQGRMEHGDRTFELGYVARYLATSTELASLKAQTEGTAVITVTGGNISEGVDHKLSISAPRVRIKTAVIDQSDGIVTVAVQLLPMTHSVNGLLKIEVTCEQDDILTAAA